MYPEDQIARLFPTIAAAPEMPNVDDTILDVTTTTAIYHSDYIDTTTTCKWRVAR